MCLIGLANVHHPGKHFLQTLPAKKVFKWLHFAFVQASHDIQTVFWSSMHDIFSLKLGQNWHTQEKLHKTATGIETIIQTLGAHLQKTICPREAMAADKNPLESTRTCGSSQRSSHSNPPLHFTNTRYTHMATLTSTEWQLAVCPLSYVQFHFQHNTISKYCLLGVCFYLLTCHHRSSFILFE